MYMKYLADQDPKDWNFAAFYQHFNSKEICSTSSENTVTTQSNTGDELMNQSEELHYQNLSPKEIKQEQEDNLSRLKALIQEGDAIEAELEEKLYAVREERDALREMLMIEEKIAFK
ncbi:hypothetical protein K501DRAFT_265214 [Backusella circina FSU 941]|nr:hypothetical protein K501DRAFT_265214 [Backusella circina FSU 941]